VSAATDPGALAALHARCFATPPPWTAASFAELLADPQVWLLDDHQARGFALMRVVADEAELLTLAVDPDCRRCGVASDLLGRFDRLALAEGAAFAFLEVAETNLAARALYAARGWELAGCRPGYYRGSDGASVGALVLRKSLVGLSDS
jgi:ribosomal-protein-alanine N-acetyltransferase